MFISLRPTPSRLINEHIGTGEEFMRQLTRRKL
jgi:hypothetical protein